METCGDIIHLGEQHYLVVGTLPGKFDGVHVVMMKNAGQVGSNSEFDVITAINAGRGHVSHAKEQ